MTTPNLAIPFSYSGDPSTSARDEVRFLIQDTDPTAPQFNDPALDYIINKWMALYGSVTFCAAIAAAQLARKYAGVTDVNDSGLAVATGTLQEKYTAMATALMAEYKLEDDVGGVPDISNILFDTSWDLSIDPLSFSMGLDDNMRAGTQEWGQTGLRNSEFDVANDGVLGGW